VTVGDPVVK